MRRTNKKKYVTIKLKKEDIPILLGACYLGLKLQTWYYRIYYAISRNETPEAINWVKSTKKIVSKIMKVTKIQDIDLSIGEEPQGRHSLMASLIDGFVTAKAKEIEETEPPTVRISDSVQLIFSNDSGGEMDS